jgi:ABC-type phosphate transport system substrate-binding protein
MVRRHVFRWSFVYAEWSMAAAYDAARYKLTQQYEYKPATSLEGQRRLAAGECQFAASDSALLPEHSAAMPNAWFVPSLAQAIAVVFRLPNVQPGFVLNIPRAVLADIFLGRIRQWSALAPWNDGLASAPGNITLVVRSDKCAASQLFTSALSSFSTEWKAKVGTSTRPQWPLSKVNRQAMVTVEGDDGVVKRVLQTPYSLGYASQAYLSRLGITAGIARISNAAGDAAAAASNSATTGRFVEPSESSVTAAMNAGAAALDEMGGSDTSVFALSIVDPPPAAADAYPIAGFTYIAFDAGRLDCVALRAVVYLIYWAWTNPEATIIAQKLTFYPLSQRVVESLIKAVKALQCATAAGGTGTLDMILGDEVTVIVGAGAGFP